MRFLGLHIPSFSFAGVDGAGLFPRLVEIAATAERSGFTALSVMDHVHQIAPHGDPAAVRHKVEVLAEHCEAEGRDIAEIVKTVHAGTVVIDETAAGVRRCLESLAASPPPVLRALDADQLGRELMSGTPDQVAARLQELIDAGADGVTMRICNVEDLAPIELAATAAGVTA